MSKRIVILLIAILSAGVAGYIAMNMASPSQTQVAEVAEVAPAIELDEVLVASKTIPTGTALDGQLRWQDWPVGSLSPDFITRSVRPEAIMELTGSVVRSTIAQGEPVRSIKLLGPDQSFMSSILPPGKRAVATAIAADTSAGGFILPDDYVDVIMTTRPPGREGSFVTETILENIRVLAIDQTIREDENGRLVQVGQTATLQLTPRQAEIITVAQQMADRLTLALRSVRDVDTNGGDKGAEHLLSGAAASGGAITVIKSGQRSEVQTR
ncbi:Flp pilus assembly protein CpaB [Oricola cellulosilytica]|uniref:Flp pilus assembly protein CpaB n=1 Tax=Oricola cellulosilytica TaxID=1429082 RepID=A0A4R0PFK7_9HYPH|nr:Flp pilus assembly protein CpaB [Oricola cellulosilytica]TCD16421.1 Flp pilus assembly protein CpaB [Oricola cellulosilytica]